jgi:hypothetical protein
MRWDRDSGRWFAFVLLQSLGCWVDGALAAAVRRRVRASDTMAVWTCHARWQLSPDRVEDKTVQLQPRTRTVLAWSLFLASLGCCAVGITLVLVLVRPLRAGVLTGAVVLAMAYLSFAVIGLVLSVRRPANPIGWLYAASGLVWCLTLPGGRPGSTSWSAAAAPCP